MRFAITFVECTGYVTEDMQLGRVYVCVPTLCNQTLVIFSTSVIIIYTVVLRLNSSVLSTDCHHLYLHTVSLQ